MSKMGQGINKSLFIVIKKILTSARGKNLQSMPMSLQYRPKGLLYMPLSMHFKVANSSVSRLVAPSRNYRLHMKGKFVIYLPQSFGEKNNFAIVAWSTVHDSTVCKMMTCVCI